MTASLTEKAILRTYFLRCCEDYHALADRDFDQIGREKRLETVEFVGAVAASYLDDLGGMMSAW